MKCQNLVPNRKQSISEYHTGNVQQRKVPSIPHVSPAFLSAVSHSHSSVLSIDIGRDRLQWLHSGVNPDTSRQPTQGYHGNTFQLEVSVARPTRLFCISSVVFNFQKRCRPSINLLSTIPSMAEHPEQLEHDLFHEDTELPSNKVQHWMILWSFHMEIACCEAALFQCMLEVLA